MPIQYVLQIPRVQVHYEYCVYVCKCAHGSADVGCGSRADLVQEDFGSALKEKLQRRMEGLIAVCQRATLKRQQREKE